MHSSQRSSPSKHTVTKKSRLYTYSALLWSAFVVFLYTAREAPQYFLPLDTAVLQAISPLQTYHSVLFFLSITQLGSAVAVILIGGGIVYFIRHQRRNALEFVVALAGTSLWVQLTKIFVERVRPDAVLWLSPLHSYSFPSGHAASAVTLYGFTYLIVKKEVQNPLLRNIALVMCAALIFGICLSRIVLQVHYASDVLGGALLASAWLLFVRAFGMRK
jgi:undecaprenyl-diphosphatase